LYFTSCSRFLGILLLSLSLMICGLTGLQLHPPIPCFSSGLSFPPAFFCLTNTLSILSCMIQLKVCLSIDGRFSFPVFLYQSCRFDSAPPRNSFKGGLSFFPMRLSPSVTRGSFFFFPGWMKVPAFCRLSLYEAGFHSFSQVFFPA